MKDKPVVEHRKQKLCLCQLAPTSKVFLKATHQHNTEGQSEYKCWMCGRTAYLTA